MKIGFLIYSLQGGGAERVVSRLANAFAAEHNEVTIFLMDISGIAYQLDDRVKIKEITGKCFEKRTQRLCSYMKMARKELNEAEIEVLLAFTVSMVPFAIYAACGRKCKVIGAERTNPLVLSKKYKLIAKMLAPFCDGYIFQTDGAKKCYPLSVQKKAAVIGNVVPCVELYSERDYSNLRICSVGRLHNDKDFPTLLRAFARVLKKYPQAELSIFGDGEQKDELMKLSSSLGIENSVIFEGFVKKLSERMKQYSIFVLSSKAEGMPNALMEAMASGLACISSDCNFGPAELIEDGVNGYLVPVEDVESLATRIEELLENPIQRERIGRAAIEIQERYSEEKIVKKYLNYVNRIGN